MVKRSSSTAPETSQRIIRLSRAASIAFAKTVLNPPDPNESLLRAAAEYRKMILQD
jgi:uncharacterized protein (DUF1778 family)